MTWDTLASDRQAFIASHLTDLQLQVVRARLNTFTFRQIADAMNIDEATVRGHYKRAQRRLANATREDTNEQTAA